MSKKRKNYTEEFKIQIVKLVNSGKSINSASKEYNISTSTIHNWVHSYNNTKSFNINENRSEEEIELIKLRKRNKQLEMEVDILKQAALIMGQK